MRVTDDFLLGASAYFYMAFVPKYVLILVGLILLDYTTALALEGAQGRRRRLWLGLSLTANVAAATGRLPASETPRPLTNNE